MITAPPRISAAAAMPLLLRCSLPTRTAIPMVKIAPSNKIVFPPAGANESVYQTVQIVNTSDTPVYYKILQDSTKTFRAYPPIGIINGKSFSLVCFEFQPK